MSASFCQEESLFTLASALPAEAREDFVARACGADDQLRRSVIDLLEAARTAGRILEPVSVAPAGRSPAGADERPQPGTRIGRYRLLHVLGEGGAGIVFEAEQETPVRRRAALKLLRAGANSAAAATRFTAECQALALMEHPNIARVFDAGSTDDGRFYFVMELVRGTRVTTFSDENRLSLDERVPLLVPTCLAVEHAHAKGFVHRDLKPSNVLVTRYDTAPMPKIIDFGIAKPTAIHTAGSTDDVATLAYVIGTPAYMSPEQARAGVAEIDPRADIYSLGVLLYELLTGCLPFEAAAIDDPMLEQVRRRICHELPPSPSARVLALTTDRRRTIARQRRLTLRSFAPRLRGPLDAIVMRCLEKDPTQRYATAGALAMALQRYREIPAPPRRRRPASTPPLPEAQGLAVPPMAAIGQDAGCVAFAADLHEDLVSALTRFRGVHVTTHPFLAAAPSGPGEARSMAAARPVAHVLEGSVRCAGHHVRVGVQLIDVRVDAHMWAETFDRELGDVLALQTDRSGPGCPLAFGTSASATPLDHPSLRHALFPGPRSNSRARDSCSPLGG